MSEASKTSVDDAEAKVQAKFQAGAGAGPRPHPADPTPVRPKTPAPPLMGRAPRPGAVRIRKPVVQGAVLAAALLVSGSLAWAFVVQPQMTRQARDAAEADGAGEARGDVRPSERVTDQPASYDRLAQGDALPERRGTPPEAQASRTLPPPDRVPSPSYAAVARASRPAEQAAASGLFFASAPGAAASEAGAAEITQAQRGPSETAPASAMRDYGSIYSPHGLLAPVSPYELKAGAIIPGVLLTAVDTSRPGPVVAAVSQNVFDSITGRHLVVPQGARLIGRHEGESAQGDRRAFLVWDRLILPNGKSLLLTEEPGVDAQGAVGVRGAVDRRLGSLGLATLFAGAVTTLGELARGGSEDRSFAASAGSAASIEASQVGGRLIDRELRVQPTVRVRAGAPVRVMITRDLILEPYRR
ncbi:type IV secretory pathway VirB10-like protein [Brevundimonas vesicularis]|uniref:TrbI/VirB10 family protein n=1 Tax=Brevundimonas vesicularis TaxID=41276 RepID=UPI0027894868|nr:TrbI/VirB10 family protein [Brevundimonas vesicularis]MDQ1193890.1 type IV secretory pathway VirB10-like protein [Brevundimonas vesicularis]